MVGGAERAKGQRDRTYPTAIPSHRRCLCIMDRSERENSAWLHHQKSSPAAE
jgi:hypothetical protein